MKVTIGPYVNGINPHSWVKALRDKGILRPERDDFEDDVWDNIAWFLQGWFNYLWNESFVFKRKRNIKVKLHSYDMWNVDDTLAHIIHPVLVKLKTLKQGSPLVEDDDVPVELRSTSAPEMNADRKAIGDVDDFYHKRWDWVLDEMIFAFSELLSDWEDKFYDGDNVDWDGRKAHAARMQNGFRLFGKYYWNLWC